MKSAEEFAKQIIAIADRYGPTEFTVRATDACLARDAEHAQERERLEQKLAEEREAAMRVLEANRNNARERERLECGHPKELLVKSVESDYQYCELCNCKNERSDALQMEAHYKAELGKAVEREQALNTRISELEQEREKLTGMLDIIVRELDHDDEALLANDYGGLDWEKTPAVQKALDLHRLHHEHEQAAIAAALREAAHEIMTSASAVGGWLDSPKAIAAAILKRITPAHESALDKLLAEIEDKWHRRWHRDTGIPCDGSKEYCPKRTIADTSPGDVISAESDGTIVLDDGLTTWDPKRATEFLLAEAKREMRERVIQCIRKPRIHDAMRAICKVPDFAKDIERDVLALPLDAPEGK